MDKLYEVKFDRADLDTLNGGQKLRKVWEQGGYATDRQSWKLWHSLLEMDFKCEELSQILREKIIPATLENDEERLYNALHEYRLRLWEILEFRYAKLGVQAIDKITDKLSDKLYPGEG
jgi:hypothetical protein